MSIKKTDYVTEGLVSFVGDLIKSVKCESILITNESVTVTKNNACATYKFSTGKLEIEIVEEKVLPMTAFSMMLKCIKQ